MSTHPYIPLYVDDYDAHTVHLTPEEDGFYGRLLRLAWRTPGCSLPNDRAWIGRKVRATTPDQQATLDRVLTEYFTLLRGRLVQKRLKAEYELISRKKSARKEAGKKGGEAKARKTHEKASSNASDLPADTRAFPEPYPDPEDRLPQPPPGGRPEDVFEIAFAAYPLAGQSSTQRQKALKAWIEVTQSETPERLVSAAKAYAASDYATEGNGRRVPSFQRWLTDGKYAPYLPQVGSAGAAPSWPGPAEIRAEVARRMGEDRTHAYLDRCRWRDVPERAVVTTSETVATALRQAIGDLLEGLGVVIVLERAA